MLAQDDDVFLEAYSLTALHKRLRAEAALHPDTMDQRYGAYAQLLALFRMIHDGARSDTMVLPPRHGVLFDPDEYRFLEGRGAQVAGGRQVGERIEAPRVPDGTIYRVLEKLLVLKGERISYRALDVEHIGSVYETMMGFRLEKAKGRSVAIKATKHGAPTTVNLEALLESPPAGRAKWIRDHTDRKITANVSGAVRGATTIEALRAALGPVVDNDATPDLVPPGSMVLQPSEERRRSGSHYTPRELTEPIVRDTLKPVLDRLRDEVGAPPAPEQLLDLKVCDPAMGSGAFLVEACRQIGAALVESWHHHGVMPDDAKGEDELVLARREVARRCLYGVDRNPVAVDLAKLSLWMVTLSKDLPLTFLDHALHHGDSLVGLTNQQIASFHWKVNAPTFQPGFEADKAKDVLDRVKELRRRIREAGEGVPDWKLRDMLDEATVSMDAVRRTGDLVLSAYFDAEKPKAREAVRARLAEAVAEGKGYDYGSWLDEMRRREPSLAPFHWEVEFPEVFERRNHGFDAIVGNPPFLGGRNVSATQGRTYSEWLRLLHEGSSGAADLASHFFRRSFHLLRQAGTFGLIATNTIRQGDTRAGGLTWICEHGGQIFSARTRMKWPGLAAVVVSVVHVVKGQAAGFRLLDARPVERITAFLFHRGGHSDPARLKANAGISFQGSIILGMGFTFDDADKKGVATPIAEMRRLLRENSRNQEVILPYIGGQEINQHPSQSHRRYVICFGEQSEQTVRDLWPELMEIVETKVKPERMKKDGQRYPRMVYEWWKYWNARPTLYSNIVAKQRVLAVSRVGQHVAFAFLPNGMVYAESMIVFPLDTYAAFCALQSRVHEAWARFFGSSMKDDLRYTPSDVFETFPFPENWETHPALEAAGKEYYQFRANLMVHNNEGLTKTYNRFHDPNENAPEIARLRDLHAAMDRAILNAYGWTYLPTDCKFLLDYEIDEEEWSRKKKPYRYRWKDKVRNKVLAHLLELNGQRATEEADMQKAELDKATPSSRRKSR